MPMSRGSSGEKIVLRKGHDEYQFRKNSKGEWESKSPNASSWNKVRTVGYPDEEVERQINKLKEQGYS